MPTAIAAPDRSLVIALMLTVLASQPVLTLACQEQPRPQAPGPIGPVDLESPPDSVLQAHFRRLKFDSAHGLTDAQLLITGEDARNARVGPFATIQPEVNLPLAGCDTAFREGRVVARIMNHGTVPYEPLALPPKSITYWWVQYVEDASRGRSVLIATDSASGRVLRRTEMGLDTVSDPGRPRYSQPVARWHLIAAVTKPCFPCCWFWCQPSPKAR